MKTTLFSLLFLFPFTIFGQDFTIDFSVPADTMIYDFFMNDSVTVSNVQVNPGNFSMGFFDRGDTDFPIGAGIVLSTGHANDIPNPAPIFVSSGLQLVGDPDIDLATNNASHDAVWIEFDFVPSETQLLDFKYIFGSEEYPEFVGSEFNDAFLFLVSGPGFNGIYSNNAENTAMIPGDTIPVTINNVNQNVNTVFYEDNSSSNTIVFDGVTTLLPANFTVEQGITYHAKIVIADVADGAFDSGIFLGYNSLGNIDSLVPPTTASFTVTQTGELIIENKSKYATHFEWDFGNGQTSDLKHPAPVQYDEPGMYEVSLTTSNYCCTNTFTQSIEIKDFVLSLSVDVLNHVSCFGGDDGAVQVDISGGTGAYEVIITPAVADLNNIPAGTYTLTIQDGEEEISTTFTIEQPDVISVVESITNSEEGQSNGSISIDIAGGVAPYSILWSTGETTTTIENLEPGQYEVEVTDANDCVWNVIYEVGTLVAVFESTFESFGLRPNPASTWLYMEDVPSSITRVFITSSDGNAVIQEKQIINENSIDISSLNAGLYILVLEDNDGKIYRAKFVKI